MPRVDAGAKQDREERTSGELRVVFQMVADKIIEGRDGKPPALKVVFKSAVSDTTANYAVPIGQENADEAKARVNPFTDGEPANFTEAGLRTFVESNVKPGPFLVRTWGDFIQAFKADIGEHDGYLVDLRMTKNGDRVWFTLQDEDGFESDFPAPYYAVHKKGETPEQDTIGGRDPDDESVQLFAAGKGPFPYLISLGLDWERFAMEGGELCNAPALWPGHFDDDGIPMEPYLKLGQGFPPPHSSWCYFGDINDPTPELLDATRRHGLKPVSWEVVETAKYGIGVKRGDFFFELTPIKIKGGGKQPAGPSRAEQEFEREAGKFMENYDALTNAVLAPENGGLRFMVADHFTDQGKRIGMSVLKPLIYRYPDAVTAKKENGEPAIALPPTFQTWTLNGVVVANMTAERLLLLAKLDQEDLFKVVNLTDPAPLLAWVAENVPEWETVGQTDDGGELL